MVGVFWPLYVWRRFARHSANAKRKARFLQRVWKTLIKIRHLRAWHNRVTLLKGRRCEANTKLRVTNLELIRTVFCTWHKYTVKVRRRERVLEQQRDSFRPFLAKCVSAWRFYASGRAETRSMALRLRFVSSPSKSFPNAAELGVRPGWNSGIDVEQILALTKPMHLYFEHTHLPRELKVVILRTRHLIPKCLKQWRHACHLWQRERKLRYFRYIVKLRHFFTKLSRFARQARNDREAMRAFATGDLQERRERLKQRTKEARQMFSSRWDIDAQWREQGLTNTRMLQMELQDMISIRRKNESNLRLHGRRMGLERSHAASVAKTCIENVELETKAEVEAIRQDAIRVYIWHEFENIARPFKSQTRRRREETF